VTQATACANIAPEVTPVVKLIYCISKKPGMSIEEFQRYWREVHAPIAGAIPGVRRYVQCHAVPETYGGPNAPGFDGAAELWWDSIDAMRAAMATPELRAAIEDEKNFIDHTRVASFVTTENVVVACSPAGGEPFAAGV
jgi:uncharacterized protein (TIGR02118 family)